MYQAGPEAVTAVTVFWDAAHAVWHERTDVSGERVASMFHARRGATQSKCSSETSTALYGVTSKKMALFMSGRIGVFLSLFNDVSLGRLNGGLENM
jgi:hypothetical protein